MTNINKEEKMNKQQALDKIKELQDYVARLDGEWKKGGRYWHVDGRGDVIKDSWDDVGVDKARLAFGNVFRTEHEAEMHKLRIESMGNRWLPEMRENYYLVDLEDGEICPSYWSCSRFDISQHFLGNCHKTEADAQAWKDKYFEAFKEER